MNENKKHVFKKCIVNQIIARNKMFLNRALSQIELVSTKNQNEIVHTLKKKKKLYLGHDTFLFRIEKIFISCLCSREVHSFIFLSVRID